MKIMFWNTHKNDKVNPYISSLVKDYGIDILVLAEYTADAQELHRMIRNRQRWLEQYTTIGCDRINIFGNYRDVKPSVQNKYYSIQIIKGKYILCGIHLPSDLHGNMELERLSLIKQIMDDVQKEEDKISSRSTVIVGDFNEMPYAIGCLSANGFHGLPVYEKKGSKTRMVLGKEYPIYYNPMWNFFGDFSSPPGTYYRNSAVLSSPMWYMLDQFIFGYDIIPYIAKDQLSIITDCSLGSLMDKNGHPDKRISDHFPIKCELMI